MEPLISGGLGVLVGGGLVIAMYLPIFQMGSGLMQEIISYLIHLNGALFRR